ncbi:HAMP domain-containing histidine kinase [Streptomyces sp. NEAU-sy36]|uniref:sensor histidine kinase n=1 Tax=unclassified Streptomyces TaxID=2593676 RepID=UPI0015D5EF93|nr:MULTISPECIES: HAMP domain-containing sensor histidine kinase [unclassified Streptomyces]QLJ02572.1 HAMP domain-containing histidine kinase [Streptomyces sp. NEAU-sy36]
MLRTRRPPRTEPGPRPVGVRLRLTLAVSALAAVLLTLAAVASAVAARDSLLTSAFQRVTDGTGAVVTESPLCETSFDDTCGDTSRDWRTQGFDSSTGQDDTIPHLRGEHLSLRPWTDQHDATPVELIRADGTSRSLTREDSDPLADAWSDQRRLNTTAWWLAGGTLGLTLVIAGGTWLVVGQVLRPVDGIRTQFAALSLSRLDQRIPEPRGGGEFTRLVATMNSALDRLDAAAARQRQFTSDVAHELRTPLACLRAELELALTGSGTADWTDAARDALQDTLHVQDITTNLLLLARLDAQAAHARTLLTKQVELSELIRGTVARRGVPDHLGLAVTTPDEPAPVTGHPGLLTRVLDNLLDNAERHAATTITVTLTADHEHRQAVIDVANDGAPIPPEHRETIFERFSRLDDARTRDTGGTGLGLAIARRITTLHHGTLTLAPGREERGGARFTVRLPLTHADTQPLVTELLHAWDQPDDIPALFTHHAAHQPLEDVVPDLARALLTAGRDRHLRALLRHVARQAPAWEVTGLADVLRDEGMPAVADALLAARTARRRHRPAGPRRRSGEETP